MTDTDDCDIFEVADDLYQALQLSLNTLNQIRNTKVHLDGYRDSYAVCSALEKVLSKHKDRI